MIFENCTLVTVDPDRRIITDGALAVDGGIIRAVGKRLEIRSAGSGANVSSRIPHW
jgi:cytosine/adenosine deaminase-related metal-dependent hydrolase